MADPTSPHAAEHARLLAALGLETSPAAALGRYLDLVATWNARVNLTGARTPAARVAVLVTPVVPVAPLLAAGPLLDVGSGNGSPGLVLAALRPDLPVTLLEPRQKRWAFLREAARAMGRPQVEVLRARHDEYQGPPVRTVTVRALALSPDTLAPLLQAGGALLVWGGGPGPDSRFAREPDPAPGVSAWRRTEDAGVSRST